jgi:hypothetical protein
MADRVIHYQDILDLESVYDTTMHSGIVRILSQMESTPEGQAGRIRSIRSRPFRPKHSASNFMPAM